MSFNFNKPQLDRQEKVQRSASHDSFDFERWANEVRPLLLAALQKRAGKS
jgi:hypothetical protein